MLHLENKQKSSIHLPDASGTKRHDNLKNLDFEHSGHTGFQEELTFDAVPTENSNNPVTSDGIKTALDAKQDTILRRMRLYGKGTVTTINYLQSNFETGDVVRIFSQNTPAEITLGGIMVKTGDFIVWSNDVWHLLTDKVAIDALMESKLEGVQINGTDLSIDGNKKVNIARLASGATFTDGDFTYTVNTDTSTVTLTAIAAEALSGIITVPDEVYDGVFAYTVTKLGDAFKNQGAKTTNMTSLILPDTITKFTGTATFYGCNGMRGIHLPKGLTGDGSGDGKLTKTFHYCSHLFNVEIPEGITKLYGTFRETCMVDSLSLKCKTEADFYGGSDTAEARAFADNKTGIRIYYPDGADAPTRITGSFTATAEPYSLMITTGIAKRFLSRSSTVGNTFTCGEFKYTVNADGLTVTLTGIAVSRVSVNVTIPCTVYDGVFGYTVTKLGDAFKNRNDLTAGMINLILPDTITEFTGTGTFATCSGLRTVKLPVLLIGDTTAGQLTNTFQGCPNLTEVEIPAGITKFWGTFGSNSYPSGVRSVILHCKSQADFYGGSGTTAARAWADNTTGITIYYPYGTAAPKRITGSFTAVAKAYKSMTIV